MADNLYANSETKIYKFSGVSSVVSDSFSPSGALVGVAYKSDGDILSVDYTTKDVLRFSGFSTTVRDSFPSGDAVPQGVCWDGVNERTIVGAESADKARIFSGFSSTLYTSFTVTAGISDVALDDNNNLLVCDHDNDKYYIHSGISSVVTSSFAGNWSGTGGVTFGGLNLIQMAKDWVNGYKYWVATHSGLSSTITSSFEVGFTVKKAGFTLAPSFTTTTRTVTTKGRIQKEFTQTVTTKARIQKQVTQTVTAKGRIQKSFTQTLTAKGRIYIFSTQTVTAKGNIYTTAVQTVATKAAIFKTLTQTVDAKGRIQISPTQTLTAKGRIQITTARTITAKAAVKKGFNQSVTAKATIKRTFTRTLTAVARIQITSVQTVTAKGSIYNIVEQVVTAKAAIGREFIQSSTSKARIEVLRTRTITAKANIAGTTARTVTAQGSITQTILQTVEAKANIRGTQTVTAKANIIYGATPSSLTETIREIETKLEIKWDGNSWTDETTYFLNAQGHERMNSVTKEFTASEVDFELDNTTNRFLPENTSSPIYAYLNTNVKVRFGVIIEDSYYRMFTGRIKDIRPDRRTGVANINCIDNTSLLIDKDCPRALYEDKRTDELILPLLQEEGITEYDLDQGDHVVTAAWFKNLKILPTISALCVAERGRTFFDRFGKFVFWNRTHLDKQASMVTLTRNDMLTNFSLSVRDSDIKNSAVVKAKPRASAGVQVVWTNGNIQALNPYTDTLVWIPAHDQQVAYLEMEDPCTAWITPVANTDYIANTQADGSGTDRTSNIIISEFVSYADACYIAVENPTDDDIYLTKFQIRASPLKVWTWIKIVEKHETSISLYGERELEIENDFITTEDTAKEVASAIIRRAWEAKNKVKVRLLGLPNLICGDVVTVEITDSDSKDYMIEDINWELNERGFLESFKLVNPYEPATTQTVTARGNLKNTVSRTVTAKANIS